MPNDTERLNYLISIGGAAWRASEGAYVGRWTQTDGHGCMEDVTPCADDPRDALDLAIAESKQQTIDIG
jgi:hypothetical protein